MYIYTYIMYIYIYICIGRITCLTLARAQTGSGRAGFSQKGRAFLGFRNDFSFECAHAATFGRMLSHLDAFCSQFPVKAH